MTANLSTEIIEGVCLPWAAANINAISWIILIISYALPLMAMLFSYTRIVYKLQRKVTPTFQ